MGAKYASSYIAATASIVSRGGAGIGRDSCCKIREYTSNVRTSDSLHCFVAMDVLPDWHDARVRCQFVHYRQRLAQSCVRYTYIYILLGASEASDRWSRQWHPCVVFRAMFAQAKGTNHNRIKGIRVQQAEFTDQMLRSHHLVTLIPTNRTNAVACSFPLCFVIS